MTAAKSASKIAPSVPPMMPFSALHLSSCAVVAFTSLVVLSEGGRVYIIMRI